MMHNFDNNPRNEIHGRGLKSKQMITSFTKENEFLSNFYRRHMVFDGDCYQSSEHAYQSFKATNQDDRERVVFASNPREARKIGKQIDLVDNWNEIKIEVMYDILVAKFSAKDLRRALIATGDKYLIEGNSWGDRFWGCELEGEVWVGKNNLGLNLMLLREQLKEQDGLNFSS